MVGSWLASGELKFQKGSLPLTDKYCSLSLKCYENNWFMLNTCSSSRRLEFANMPDMEGVPTRSSPSKNPELHWLAPFPTCWHNSWLEGTKHILCDSTGRALLKVCSWFPLGFVLSAFSFCSLCLVSFFYNKSWPWVWLYAESCESF